MQEAAPHRPWVGRCLQDPASDQGMVWVGRDPRRSRPSPEQGAQNHSTAEAGGGPLRISQARARHTGRHPGGVWLSPEQEPPAQPLWAACPSALSPSHASVCARCLPSCHRAQPAEPGSILLHPPIHTEEIEALGSPSPRIMESLRLEKVPNRTCSNPEPCPQAPGPAPPRAPPVPVTPAAPRAVSQQCQRCLPAPSRAPLEAVPSAAGRARPQLPTAPRERGGPPEPAAAPAPPQLPRRTRVPAPSPASAQLWMRSRASMSL